jgi:hypothetical protein
MHVLFQGRYQMAPGEDVSGHPKHSDRLPYDPEDIEKLRKGITEGIKGKKVAKRT